MTAKEMLERNGDFRRSDLIDTVRRLHALFEALGIPYAIVGGLAVLRNGAPRTTADVDVLIRRSSWQQLENTPHHPFLLVEPDGMKDTVNGVDIDVLFGDDDWGMAFLLPDPGEVAEMDAELGARFIGLLKLLELKTGIYMQKSRDEGPEVAAKDLADLVALIRANAEKLGAAAMDTCHPAVRGELKRIALAVAGPGKKRGPSRPGLRRSGPPQSP